MWESDKTQVPSHTREPRGQPFHSRCPHAARNRHDIMADNHEAQSTNDPQSDACEAPLATPRVGQAFCY